MQGCYYADHLHALWERVAAHRYLLLLSLLRNKTARRKIQNVKHCKAMLLCSFCDLSWPLLNMFVALRAISSMRRSRLWMLCSCHLLSGRHGSAWQVVIYFWHKKATQYKQLCTKHWMWNCICVCLRKSRFRSAKSVKVMLTGAGNLLLIARCN